MDRFYRYVKCNFFLFKPRKREREIATYVRNLQNSNRGSTGYEQRQSWQFKTKEQWLNITWIFFISNVLLYLFLWYIFIRQRMKLFLVKIRHLKQLLIWLTIRIQLGFTDAATVLLRGWKIQYITMITNMWKITKIPL